MATNSVQGKWDRAQEEEEEEEEEEEALSLCDLPDTLMNCKEQDQSKIEESHINETQEEFDFRSWGGLFSKEPEMCAADDVFFQGQILPLRFSFSSEAGLIPKHEDDGNFGKQVNHCESRSESLDHVFLSECQSNSSRSSSIRSQNSSSSTSSTTTTTTTTITPRISKPRIQNQLFHTHPSPKPQLRVPGPRQTSYNNNQGRKSSSTWEFFRLGVVPAPEIGLQDLKVRNSSNSGNKNCVSRNSSNSSSSSNSNSNSIGTSNANSTRKNIKRSNKTTHHGDKSNHGVLKQFVDKGGGLFMNSCKCSAETVRSEIVMIKSGTKSSNKTESSPHAMKEKVVELKKQKHWQKQGKKVMSRRRTFEWLKELHACHPDEEALLSNP